MANLGFKVLTNTTYKDIEELLGIVLTPGIRYSIETTNKIYICSKDTIPDEEEGFRFNGISKFYYRAEDGVKLYVKAPYGGSTINIAE